MYPGSSPLSPSPYAFPLDALSGNPHSFSLVPSRGGRGGALLRPVAFYLPVTGPSTRALVGPPFPRPCRLFPFLFPSPPTGIPCVVRYSSCRVWGATLAHRTRHRQDTQLRPARWQAQRAVLQDN